MSRTTKSITNSEFAFLYYAANLLLGFVSRKVFIDNIGIDVLGLNQTAQNLLGFLNLAELGIGSAISFTLYKPLAQNDQDAIREIVTVQGYLYRRIAYVVGLGAILLSIGFPWIFAKSGLALWYAYASFGVFLYSSLLTYIVNYKQIVLSASQQEFLITKNYHFVMLFKSVVQIFAIIYLPYPYVFWLILQVVFATFGSWNLNRTVYKHFPYLRIELSQGTILLEKYSIIITKVKQLFFHAIGGFALTQSSSIIIYGYTTLALVAIYGNYMLIANCLRMLFNAIFQGVNAGIGNLIAEGNKQRIMEVFEELFSSRFLIITSLLYTFLKMSNSLMDIWLGKGYTLEMTTIWVIVGTMYIILSRTTVDAYIYATGLFQDVWAPIAETVLNIGLSVLLGSLYGITGVLSGVLISLIIIVFLWKPYFLFKYGLKHSFRTYILMYVKHIIVLSFTYIVCEIIMNCVSIKRDNLITWCISSAIHLLVFAGMLYCFLYFTSKGMRDFTARLKGLVKL